jgi:enamine deaminase RidA (YjgF/YER057c/UK114 family)
LQNTIRRLPHVHNIKGRSSGSIYNGMAWVAAVADKSGSTIEAQSADLFAKLERMLAGVGSDKTRILSATIHLANLADKPAFDAAYAAWMGDNPEHWPQRTCMGAELVPGYLVEIQLVAAVNA